MKKKEKYRDKERKEVDIDISQFEISKGATMREKNTLIVIESNFF